MRILIKQNREVHILLFHSYFVFSPSPHSSPPSLLLLLILSFFTSLILIHPSFHQLCVSSCLSHFVIMPFDASLFSFFPSFFFFAGCKFVFLRFSETQKRDIQIKRYLRYHQDRAAITFYVARIIATRGVQQVLVSRRSRDCRTTD